MPPPTPHPLNPPLNPSKTHTCGLNPTNTSNRGCTKFCEYSNSLLSFSLIYCPLYLSNMLAAVNNTPLTVAASPVRSFSTSSGSKVGQWAGKSWEDTMERASLIWLRTTGGVESIRPVMSDLIWACVCGWVCLYGGVFVHIAIHIAVHVAIHVAVHVAIHIAIHVACFLPKHTYLFILGKWWLLYTREHVCFSFNLDRCA